MVSGRCDFHEVNASAGFGSALGRKGQIDDPQLQGLRSNDEKVMSSAEGRIFGYAFVNNFSWVLLSVIIVVGIGLIIRARSRRFQNKGKQRR